MWRLLSWKRNCTRIKRQKAEEEASAAYDMYREHLIVDQSGTGNSNAIDKKGLNGEE